MTLSRECQQPSNSTVIRSRLGVGGFATVYEAFQDRPHRQVALKVLSRNLTKNPVFVARFQAEADACLALRHPHIAADLAELFDIRFDPRRFSDDEARTLLAEMGLPFRK